MAELTYGTALRHKRSGVTLPKVTVHESLEEAQAWVESYEDRSGGRLFPVILQTADIEETDRG